MEKKHRPTTPCLLAFNLFLGSTAWAALPLTITNPGFEDPQLSDGSNASTATGWSNFGPATEIGVFNPAAVSFTAEAPEGSNVGYVYGGVVDAGLSQVLATNLEADSSYTLTVKVGNSINYPYDGYRIQLLAGGTVLAEDDNTQSPASDSFVTVSVTYNYDVANAALVGQPLEIRLLGKGLSDGTGETEFDDVQLTAALGNPLAVPGGPYTVVVGGSLSLDGSDSLPSENQTLTTYEWDLDNDGDFDEGITGSTPTAIAYADLQTTYGMSIGPNTIKLRVTDDSSPTPKTSVAEGTVTLSPPATDGTWITTVDGSWSDTANWLDGIVANGVGATAQFTLNLTRTLSVNVDTPRTLGHISKNDTGTGNFQLRIIGSGPLTLDDNANPATITNAVVGNPRRLEILTPVTGTGDLTIDGGGIVRITNTVMYTGATRITGLLDFTSIPLEQIGGGAAAGRNITLTEGSAIQFNNLSNAYLQRLVETTDKIGVFTNTTNDLDFSGSTGANLPNAFLGSYRSNAGKTEYNGIVTPASDAYRFGHPMMNGNLGILQAHGDVGGTPRGLIVGGGRVVLVGENTFTGDTVLSDGRLFLGKQLALQNSALDVGESGGQIGFENGTGNIGKPELTNNPTLGGLKGSRNLSEVITTAGLNNSKPLELTEILGFVLNVGTGKTCSYSGNISDLAPGTTITKTGPGTQVLSGTNDYTGATTISEGILSVGTTGVLASTSVSIAAGATLDVQGSWAMPASQTFNIGLNGSDGGTSGWIAAENLDITNGAVQFNISGSLDDAVYVLATYSSLTGSSFASVGDIPSGYTLDYAYEGNKIALIQSAGSPFDTWAATGTLGAVTFDGDTNGDGVQDGMAFLLGVANPDDDANDRLPNVSKDGSGNLVLQFDCLPSEERGTSQLRVAHSSTLAGWTATVDQVPDTDDAVPDNNVTFVVVEGPAGPPALNTVTATIQSAAASDGKLFGRLEASK